MAPGDSGPLSSDPHTALRQLWDTADDVDPVCRQYPELFFSMNIRDQRQAKALCDECPMRAICNQYAVVADERYGTWGGQVSPEGYPVPPLL